MGDIDERIEMAEVAIHGINAFDNDQPAFVFVTNKGGIERRGIVMLETVDASPRQDRAVAQTEVRTIVHHGDIAFPHQSRDRAEGAAEPAVEKHRVLVAEEFRHPFFELPMKIGHAGKGRRSARAHAVGVERFVGGGDHVRMIGEAEVVVGTKIDDRVRLASVIQDRARLGRAE